jgi:hypothetical protein
MEQGTLFENTRKNRLGLLMWTLINNNVITPSMEICCMIIDLGIQMFFILSLYQATNTLYFLNNDI